MRYFLFAAGLWTLAGLAAADDEFGGRLRAHREVAEGAAAAGTTTLDTELHGRWKAWSANVAWAQQRTDDGAWRGDGRVNELYASGDALGWQWSAGRKIVAWDVGYGFRPNDAVQQEQRRTLFDTTPQGRAVLQAEHYGAQDAWSLVWVNPQRPAAGMGGDEQALALRAYRREGAVDWHGFARAGERTHASLGLAASWVAGDSLELHASARREPGRDRSQALLGGTWTGEGKLSLVAEAWFDGAAAAAPLRRNVYLRAAWEHEGWQPVVDLLLVPDDRSHVATAALAWQGDRWRLEAGQRWTGGEDSSLLARAPVRRIAYLAATWPF